MRNVPVTLSDPFSYVLLGLPLSTLHFPVSWIFWVPSWGSDLLETLGHSSEETRGPHTLRAFSHYWGSGSYLYMLLLM